MSNDRQDDRHVCLCYHVSMGKLAKYVRLHKPPVATELANCYGAGTGCGWCIPYLEKIHQQVASGEEPSADMPYEEYVKRRAEYRKALGLDATPPPKSEFAPPDDEFDDLVSTED
jgi:NAD(P)H-nitrite reductase large subunit